MHRRELLKMAAAAGTASVLASRSAEPNSPAGDGPVGSGIKITDTNVSLFQWPFRRLPLDELNKLVMKLRTLGITQAWAGSFEGVLQRDIAGVNQRLADACAGHSTLIPMGSVNPQLPDWTEDLRRCIEQHHMPGIRLHPNYHQYALDDPNFARLLEIAARSDRLVQIAATMEDTRTQHPQVQVPDVELGPLAELMPRFPRARVQILNYRPRKPLIDALAKTPGVYFDTARADGTDGVPALVRQVTQNRVMFGTHAPFLIPESALIRLHESSRLDSHAFQRVLYRNAETALKPAKT